MASLPLKLKYAEICAFFFLDEVQLKFADRNQDEYQQVEKTKEMNKYLKHYNREQQIKYLELNTMIDVMFLKLGDFQEAELNEHLSVN